MSVGRLSIIGLAVLLLSAAIVAFSTSSGHASTRAASKPGRLLTAAVVERAFASHDLVLGHPFSTRKATVAQLLGNFPTSTAKWRSERAKLIREIQIGLPLLHRYPLTYLSSKPAVGNDSWSVEVIITSRISDDQNLARGLAQTTPDAPW